jgi:hypothetical protein
MARRCNMTGCSMCLQLCSEPVLIAMKLLTLVGRDIAFWIVRLRVHLRLLPFAAVCDAFDATRVLLVPTLQIRPPYQYKRQPSML